MAHSVQANHDEHPSTGLFYDPSSPPRRRRRTDTAAPRARGPRDAIAVAADAGRHAALSRRDASANGKPTQTSRCDARENARRAEPGTSCCGRPNRRRPCRLAQPRPSLRSAPNRRAALERRAFGDPRRQPQRDDKDAGAHGANAIANARAVWRAARCDDARAFPNARVARTPSASPARRRERVAFWPRARRRHAAIAFAVTDDTFGLRSAGSRCRTECPVRRTAQTREPTAARLP